MIEASWPKLFFEKSYIVRTRDGGRIFELACAIDIIRNTIADHDPEEMDSPDEIEVSNPVSPIMTSLTETSFRRIESNKTYLRANKVPSIVSVVPWLRRDERHTRKIRKAHSSLPGMEPLSLLQADPRELSFHPHTGGIDLVT